MKRLAFYPVIAVAMCIAVVLAAVIYAAGRLYYWISGDWKHQKARS